MLTVQKTRLVINVSCLAFKEFPLQLSVKVKVKVRFEEIKK